MEQVLLKEKKYAGQYVVIKNYDDPVVISHGDDPQKSYDEAVNKGFLEPVILFVPSKEMVQIYAILKYPFH